MSKSLSPVVVLNVATESIFVVQGIAAAMAYAFAPTQVAYANQNLHKVSAVSKKVKANLAVGLSHYIVCYA